MLKLDIPYKKHVDYSVIRGAIYEVVAEDHPMTVRQVFYRLVSLGTIEKTEAEYKGTVIRLLGQMRLAKELPFDWIADNTRWMRKPDTYSGLNQALRETARFYRRALWDNQSVYVEVWLEKDALAGVLYEETAVYDVPLMVTRGYASLSYLYTAAEAIAEQDKPAFLYYFGDFDPSGVDIPRNIEQRLREFAPEAEIHFECVAVTPEQIRDWELPARPTKKTDTRSGKFDGASVEVDAIQPSMLRKLVRDRIAEHIDRKALKVLQVAEKSEREYLEQLVEIGETP